MVKRLFMSAVFLGLLVGCQGNVESQEMTSVKGEAMPSGQMYYEKEMHGRFFVIGNKDTLQKLEDNGHIPYAQTLIGEGPDGQTLVVEVDKDDPALQANLLAMYYARHPYYKVVKMHDRVYVLGNPETKQKLIANGHIPYARTLIGKGPNGETVVIEIDKSDPGLTERLEETYFGDYVSINNSHGRIFVLGNPETRAKLMDNGHIPYARTHIGMGPDGETVVIEIDKDKPEMADRLAKAYLDSWYAEEKAHGRTFVLGNPDTRAKLKSNGHIPYARTFIGKGKGGETVVVEIDKDKSGMTDRLMDEYYTRNGVSLQ